MVDDESGESMELIEEVPLGLGEVNTKSNQIGRSAASEGPRDAP